MRRATALIVDACVENVLLENGWRLTRVVLLLKLFLVERILFRNAREGSMGFGQWAQSQFQSLSFLCEKVSSRNETHGPELATTRKLRHGWELGPLLSFNAFNVNRSAVYGHRSVHQFVQ